MRKLDQVTTIKGEALVLKICMYSTDIGESLVAQDEYDSLVDKFFNEHKHLVDPGQLPDAKKDADYFIALLDSAIQFYNRHEAKE